MRQHYSLSKDLVRTTRKNNLDEVKNHSGYDNLYLIYNGAIVTKTLRNYWLFNGDERNSTRYGVFLSGGHLAPFMCSNLLGKSIPSA